MGCLVSGCTSTFKLVRGLCSKHYQQSLRGITVEQMEQADGVSIPLPPKPPIDSKRCLALVNGKRCPRGRRGHGLCAGHLKEKVDREAFALRENPIESTARGFEGDEDALARLYGRNKNG
jgi:hypothetical protein